MLSGMIIPWCGEVARENTIVRSVSAKAFCFFSGKTRGRHGRDAGYPAPPVQTRTCSFPASGASIALASAQGRTVASSGPVCYCPQGGWLMLIRFDMSGMSFLSGLVLPSRPSPCDGLSPPQSTMLNTTPHTHTADFPFDSIPPPAWAPTGASGASQVLRRLSSCMPRPEDSGGPAHPRQVG